MKKLIAILLSSAVLNLAHAVVINSALEGSQEVPPVATPGTGSASLDVDLATGVFSLIGSFSDLLGEVTAAHIHGPAPVGLNAPVQVPLTATGATSGSLSGAGTFSAQQLGWLQSHLLYVNVHSTIKPGGEIRGQLLVPDNGSGLMLTGLAMIALSLAQRRWSRPTPDERVDG